MSDDESTPRISFDEDEKEMLRIRDYNEDPTVVTFWKEFRYAMKHRCSNFEPYFDRVRGFMKDIEEYVDQMEQLENTDEEFYWRDMPDYIETRWHIINFTSKIFPCGVKVPLGWYTNLKQKAVSKMGKIL